MLINQKSFKFFEVQIKIIFLEHFTKLVLEHVYSKNKKKMTQNNHNEPKDFWNLIEPEALRIIQNLMSSPCSDVINEEKIINGKILSFGIIHQKLINREYHSTRDWYQDCGTYFQKMFDEYKNGGVQLIILKHLQLKYKKSLIYCEAKTPVGWWKVAEKLRNKLDELLKSPPNICVPYTNVILNPPYKPVNFTHQLIDEMSQCDKKITKSYDILEVLTILQNDTNALSFSGNTAKVELRHVSRPTMTKLHNYLTEKKFLK